MKLKKIKIVGFKSFADKVVLEFDDGITGVVGPNGCGKSNIADAFRWVMGEQSVKSMRGGKMQDVIFAGSSKRKSLGLAEVSLTFANTEGRVGIPYNEVEISRRYHRDGESEYLINGNSVRLKDVQSMLIDVGIGKNAYAIFEQGKIDQIIQLGPEERRSIFEDAAGISKFLMNKREAERKLSEVELNCSRLQDIHDEVQKEINHLAGQASRAKEYKELKEKGEAVEEECLSLKISNLKVKKNQVETERTAQQKLNAASEDKVLTLAHAVSKFKDELEAKEGELKAREREVYQIKAALDVRKKELETLKERLQECHNKKVALNKEKTGIQEARLRRREDRLSQAGKQTELSKSLEVRQGILKSALESMQEAEKAVAILRKGLEKAQDDLLLLTRQVSAASSDLKQKSIRFENLSERIEHSEKESAKAALQLENLAVEEKEKRKLLENVSKEVDVSRSRFDHLDTEIKKITATILETDEIYETQSKDLTDLIAREKALLRLREDMEGAGEGTKVLLKEVKRKESTLNGKLKGLWEYFDIQPGYEMAVASVLRAYGDTLVVNNEEAFKEVLEFAKNKKITDFSLVLMRDEVKPALEASLYKKVKASGIASHFLGQKAVVETLEEARALAPEKGGLDVFSLDGFFVDQCGVVFKTSQKGGSVFLREAELKTLAEKIKTLEKEVSLYRSRLITLKDNRAKWQEERAIVDKKVRGLEMQLVEKNFQLQKCLGELERIKTTQLNAHAEREKFKADRALLEKDLLDLKSRSSEEEARLQKGAEEKEKLYKNLEQGLNHLRQCKDVYAKEEQVFSRESDETRKILYTLNLIDVKDQESLAQEKRCDEEEKQIELQAKAFMEKQHALMAQQEQDQIRYQEENQAKEIVEKKHLAAKQEAKAQEKGVQDEEARLKKEVQKEQSLEVQLAQVQAQAESALKEFEEKLPGKQPRQIEGSIEKVEKEVKKIKELLASYTDVNMAAVESLDNHKGRASHLQKEMGDLAGASDELKGVIDTLEAESRGLFKNTFEAVRINFKRNFQILFNGGEADLELTQSDDLLKAGIEIVAKPPGKQMRSINLLSGGEKCLTAMALLFSLFEVKAAPFCILDEIDAPLDDTNVDRFTNMVRHFADRCQFILITHNKRTMAMADRLYGVSMEEKGVSKILMMEFQHKTVGQLHQQVQLV